MAEKRKTQAISLLEGILDDTRNEAEAERQRIEAELKAKEEAERQAREAEEARRRADAEARLAAEEERRRQAAERRAAELERMRIEELKEKGLWKEPEPEPEPAPAPVAQSTEPQRPQQSTTEALAVQQANQKKSRLGPILAAAAAVLVLGGGAAAFVIVEGMEYVDASTSFAKAEAATSPLANAVAVVGFEPIPEPEIIEAEPDDEPTTNAATTSRPASSGSSGSSSGSSGSSGASSGSSGPRLQLGGSLRRDR